MVVMGWVLIGLSGCVTVEKPPPQFNALERQWLAKIHREGWGLHGRIGVTGGPESWHGGIQWEYRDDYDRLKIAGPFGQGGVLVEMRPGWIRVSHQDGQIQESTRPQLLLNQLLGVVVPLESLHYWILGLPAPGPAKMNYGSGRRLSSLEQQGWRIEYRRYQAVGEGGLPVKVIMTGPAGVRLKLIIDRWEIRIESRSA